MKITNLLIINICLVLLFAGCSKHSQKDSHIPPGQIRKHTTPGHIQQTTGYNPASGKYHPKVDKEKEKKKD